jgi:hypothetical protein
MSVGARISVRALIRILEPNLDATFCPSNGLHLYCLTKVHTTIRVIACSLIYNRDLSYSEGTRIDCCDVISATSELGLAIIMLGGFYFMLYCWLTPTDVVPVQGHM